MEAFGQEQKSRRRRRRRCSISAVVVLAVFRSRNDVSARLCPTCIAELRCVRTLERRRRATEAVKPGDRRPSIFDQVFFLQHLGAFFFFFFLLNLVSPSRLPPPKK